MVDAWQRAPHCIISVVFRHIIHFFCIFAYSTIYCMNIKMNTPVGNVTNDTVWYTIVFKVSVFHFFAKNWLTWSKILSTIPL